MVLSRDQDERVSNVNLLDAKNEMSHELAYLAKNAPYCSQFVSKNKQKNHFKINIIKIQIFRLN